MNEYNSINLVGRICKDAEVVEFDKTKMVKFGIFVDGKPVPEGKEKNPSSILNFEKFCKKSDNEIIDILKKGKLVKVNGFMQADTYKNKDGKDITTTKFVAASVEAFQYPPKKEKEEQKKKNA